MPPGFERAQIVILSSIDWAAAWQRHQVFASQLAAAGHEVFFVENTGFRDPGPRDLGRVWARLTGFSPRSRTGLPANLRIMPPKVLPPTNRAFRRLNAAALIPRLVSSLSAAGLRPAPLVITYLPTATTLELIRRLEPRVLVYDCAANFRAHPAAPADFPAQEAELLARADLVVCDSDFLFQQKRAEHGSVVQIHQGVPECFFEAKPPAGDFRRLCYYGTWSQDLDPRFPAALQDAGFEVTISGFSKGSPPALPAGVKRLPPVRREELVSRLQDFDAFLFPYRVNQFLMGVVPAKLYECLAMGRPVLATPLPALKPLERLIHIAETPIEWVRMARDLPRTETSALREERISLAREHTCAREFQRLLSALRAAFERQK